MKRLIVITPPRPYPDEAALLNLLFEEGMSRLHLRKPDYGRNCLERLLDRIPTAYYPYIVLHDWFCLATERELGGIHLNRRNPIAPKDYNGSVSCSCHNITEVRQQKASCDYLFLSPIFSSLSKTGYGNGFPLEELQEAAQAGYIDKRVIALGGISPQSIRQLQEIPFGGFAVLGALWGDNPSLSQADQVIQQLHTLKQCL